MAVKIKLRRSTGSEWTSGNPILELGEAGIETDTRKWKVGDGSSTWTFLSYMAGTVSVFTDLDDVPADYTGFAGFFVAVNGTEDALEFVPAPTGSSTVYAGTATLTSGSSTVAATWVTADSVIVVTPQTDDASARQLFVNPSNIVAATSFDIDSSDGSDTRSVFWMATEPNPAGIINPVMKVNTSAGSAMAHKEFGSDQSEVWVTVEIAFDPAARALFVINEYSGEIASLYQAIGAPGGGNLSQASFWAEPGFVDGNYGVFRRGGTTENAPDNADADIWHTVELHFLASGVADLYVDGGSVTTTGAGAATQARQLIVGMEFGDTNPDSVMYFRSVKAGTTRGGTDLFQDDFSSEDLSNWTTTTGNVSIVSDPF